MPNQNFSDSIFAENNNKSKDPVNNSDSLSEISNNNQISTATINAAKVNKDKVLKFLGADDFVGQKEIISGHLTNDSYKENSSSIFQRVALKQDSMEASNASFFRACKEFAREKFSDNFKRRMGKSLIASLFYGGALAVTLLASPLAGIIASSVITVFSAALEAREKRNFASIGHSFEHISQAALKSVKEIYERNKENINDNTKARIEEILGLGNPSDFASKVVRYASYVSGFALSAVRFVLREAGLVTSFVSNTVLGAFIPVMPIINTAVSYGAVKLRENSFEKQVLKFETVVGEIFNPTNYKDDFKPDFEAIKNQFQESLKKPHCEFKNEIISGDNKTNIRKLVALPNWLLNKVVSKVGEKIEKIPNFAKTEDLNIPPIVDFDKLMNKSQRNNQNSVDNLSVRALKKEKIREVEVTPDDSLAEYEIPGSINESSSSSSPRTTTQPRQINNLTNSKNNPLQR